MSARRTPEQGQADRVSRVLAELVRVGTWVGVKVLAMRLDMGEQRVREALSDLIDAGGVVRRETRPKAFSRSVVYATAEVAARTPDPGTTHEGRARARVA